MSAGWWEAVAALIALLQVLTIGACFRCEQLIRTLLRRSYAAELRARLDHLRD